MKRIICALLAILIALCCVGCGSKIKTREDVDGKRIGVLENSSSEMYGRLHGEVRVCSDKKELLNALKLGDVECIVVDERLEGHVKRFKIGLKTLREPLAESRFRIAAANENPDLVRDINNALEDLKKDIKRIVNKHYDGEAHPYTPPEVSEDAPTLIVAVGDDFPPYKYRDENGELAGIDIDVARAVCAWLGLNVEFVEVRSNHLISAVQGGDAHFALGGITANSINADGCLMSDSYATCVQVIIVG